MTSSPLVEWYRVLDVVVIRGDCHIFIHQLERQCVGIVPSFVTQSLPAVIVCTVSSSVSPTVYYSTTTQDFSSWPMIAIRRHPEEE
jgi:hypothetical protein